MSDRAPPVTVPSLRARKAAGAKIVALTAYDYPTAMLLDEAGVDLILVGDSLGMVVLGYENTIPVTMDEMIHHTRAVVRGASGRWSSATCPISPSTWRRGDHPQRLPVPQGGAAPRRSRSRGPRRSG